MKKIYFLIGFFLVSSFNMIAQPGPSPSPEEIKKKVEASKKVLDKASSNEAKTKLCLELASLLLRTNRDESIEYAKKAVDFAVKSKKTDLIVNSYMSLGSGLQMSGQNAASLDYLKKGLPYLKKSNNTETNGIYYGMIAQAYMRKGQYEIALEYYQKSLFEYKKELTNMDLQALTLFQIGNVHGSLEDYMTAIKYFQQAASIWKKLENWNRLEGCWKNIGNCYGMMNNENEEEAARIQQQKYSELAKKKVTSPPKRS
jgi:tetratricopeptide (TPR) repeat protein